MSGAPNSIPDAKSEEFKKTGHPSEDEPTASTSQNKTKVIPEVHKKGNRAVDNSTSQKKHNPRSDLAATTSGTNTNVDKAQTWGEVLHKKDAQNTGNLGGSGSGSVVVITSQPKSNQSFPIEDSKSSEPNPSGGIHPNVVFQEPVLQRNASIMSTQADLFNENNNKKYYEGDADQFLRTLEYPPLDDEGFAAFEPESLGPDFCIIFRRMLNYKFRNKGGHILKPLENLDKLCVRALPDIPVAIEFAKEVDENARMRARTFALCGEDMFPKYYAVEYTPPKIALLNCVCCMNCFRQPFNLAIFGLDGQLALRIVSAPLENCWLLRYGKECCCHTALTKRMLIKTPDGAVFGSLVEFGHCFMTQWLQIHPGVPHTRADLADAAVVQWQSKCRCMDSTMLYCGCKTDPDAEGAMIMADKEGRKYATARPWTGISSEDSPFLFSIRFTEKCPVEMKALALAGSFIYNNLNWETRSDLTCCMLISCLFCTLRLWYDGGPISYDYDNWSNLPTRPATSYIPWFSINRPAVVNYRRL